MPDASSPTPKRPYTAPTLKVFGDLSRLTSAVGNTSKKLDGGTMGLQKTQ